MATTTFGDAYRQRRAQRVRQRTRRPVLAVLGAALGHAVNALARARTAVYVWGAAGFATAGLWERFGMWTGFLAIAASLLIIEALSGGDG